MTPRRSTPRLGESTAEAVAGVLARSLPAPSSRARSRSSRTAPRRSPRSRPPAVATNVSYVDGVTGGNVFVVTRLGARRLAAAMMGMEPAPRTPTARTLDELELSAVGEAMNQSMAAAAGATGRCSARRSRSRRRRPRMLRPPRTRGRRSSSGPHATAVLHPARRAVPAGPARAERLRRAHDPRPRRPRRRGRRRRRRTGDAVAADSLRACRCGSGPSSAAPGCRSAAPSAWRRARSSSSTAAPTTRSTSTSTAGASPSAGFC